MFRHRKNTCFILYLSVNVTICSLTICYLRIPYGYTIMYTCLLLSPKISSAIASDKDCTEHSFKLCHSNTLSQLSRSDIFFFLKQSKICGSVYERTLQVLPSPFLPNNQEFLFKMLYHVLIYVIAKFALFIYLKYSF